MQGFGRLRSGRVTAGLAGAKGDTAFRIINLIRGREFHAPVAFARKVNGRRRTALG
ncbi:hypothetical protein GCM10017322_22620 [Paracoccus aerius]|nr:hypothetical protein GCM10017322_22620 [Paracoccus aerius]